MEDKKSKSNGRENKSKGESNIGFRVRV